MEIGVDVDSIGLDKVAGSLIVALTLYALYLGKESGKLAAEFLVIVNLDTGLSVTLDKGNGVTVVKTPSGYQGTVAHVGLLDLIARGDTHKLSHQTIHYIAVILRLICFHIRR